MRFESAERSHENPATRAGRLLAIGLVLGSLCVVAGHATPALAQRNWEPIVATAPGGAMNGHQQLPVMVDPRRFPPPSRAPAAGPIDPLPQGAWSPLVTGALPERRPAPPPKTATPKAATEVAPTSVSPATGALSPIRPTRGGDIVTGTVQTSPPDPAAVDAAAETPPSALRPGPLQALPPNATAAQQYCFNTADTAADARFAWQAKKIQEMEAELNKRAELLTAKTEEYKKWLERRDEFSRKAHEKLVGFYSRMRADAAAAQLAVIDEETAAAVVTKLETKVASQIMGEMEPAQAAKIASVIAGAARTKPAARRRPAAGGTPANARDAAAAPGNAAAPRGRPES